MIHLFVFIFVKIYKKLYIYDNGFTVLVWTQARFEIDSTLKYHTALDDKTWLDVLLTQFRSCKGFSRLLLTI